MGLTTHIYIGPIMVIHDWDHSRPECIFDITEVDFNESLYVADLIHGCLPSQVVEAYILIPNSEDVGIHVNSSYEESFIDIEKLMADHSVEKFREEFSKEISIIEDRGLGRVEIIHRFILYFS